MHEVELNLCDSHRLVVLYTFVGRSNRHSLDILQERIALHKSRVTCGNFRSRAGPEAAREDTVHPRRRAAELGAAREVGAAASRDSPDCILTKLGSPKLSV